MTAIEIHMKHETLARLNGMRVGGLFFKLRRALNDVFIFNFNTKFF